MSTTAEKTDTIRLFFNFVSACLIGIIAFMGRGALSTLEQVKDAQGGMLIAQAETNAEVRNLNDRLRDLAARTNGHVSKANLPEIIKQSMREELRDIHKQLDEQKEAAVRIQMQLANLEKRLNKLEEK